VRYRTAAAISVGMVAVMFGLPAAVEAFLLPGLTDPVPFHEQMILEVTIFFLTWRFFLLLPAIVLPFVVATFTGDSRARK
jgi:hypothetical protein